MESPVSRLSSRNVNIHSSDNSVLHNPINEPYFYTKESDDDGLAQLISNLDHDISPIRVRALKSLQMKLEHGLINTNVLCKRVDLMHRVACWLRSTRLTEDELHLIIQFLSQLSQHEGFSKNFLSTQVDSLLAIARLVVRQDTRNLINQLLDSIQSFDLHCEGSPSWNDNTCTPLLSSRSIIAAAPITLNISPHLKPKEVEYAMPNEKERGQGELDNLTPREFYFNKLDSTVINKKNHWTNAIEFGIPTTLLQVTDRRVLASTIESILSKDEHLVFITTCFVRDILLNDFPSEIFIQENSVSLGLLQIVEDSWENERVNYSAFQTLLKLSSMLRNRFIHLDSSDYYQHGSFNERLIAKQKSSVMYHSSSSSHQSGSYLSSRESNNHYFLGNLTQFIKGIVRGLNYKSKCTNLWTLLNSYCLTFETCVKLCGGTSTALSLNLQEILLELAQFFLKNSRSVNPPMLAIAMSSLLSCLEDKDNIVLSKDVRHAIWNLASQTNLHETAPGTFAYFMDEARPFQAGLDNIYRKNGENLDSEFTLDNIYNDWWRFDKTESNFRLKDSIEPTSSDSEPNIISALHSIQNATEHKHVQNGIEHLWESAFTLVLNSRNKDNGEIVNTDLEVISATSIQNWREALDKFLLVEPTCVEDEELLARVLDILSFVITWLGDSRQIRKWIEQLVTEKGSAVLRVLIQNCLHNEMGSSSDGTTLSVILRSVFDFYQVIFLGNGNEFVSPDVRWEYVQLLTKILERISEHDYSSTASLQCVLFALAQLSSDEFIFEKLAQHEELATTLLNRLVEAIFLSQEKAGQDSFRNHTTIHYGSKLLLHIVLVFIRDSSRPIQWSSRIIRIIPLLWSSPDCVVRSIGFQLCCILSRTNKGTSYLLSELESPALLWSNAYTRLISSEEIPVVRQAAGTVLLNLINSWEEMTLLIDAQLQVPKWKIIEDLTRLLLNMYWHSTLSNLTQEKYEARERIEDDPRPIITPKVLTVVARLVVKSLSVGDGNQPSLGSMPNEKIIREICGTLFRLIGDHHINTSMSNAWWVESCSSLSNVTQALTTLVQLYPQLSLDLLADKLSLSALIKLLALTPPEGIMSSLAEETLSLLWFQIVVLLTTLTTASKQHFEDLERIVLTHRNMIFPRLVEWLDSTTERKYCKVTIEFLIKFMSISCGKDEEAAGRSFLGNLWQETSSEYGSALCQKLIILIKTRTRMEERVPVLMCCDVLFRFFKLSAIFAVKLNLIGCLVKILKAFGVKSIEVTSQYEQKDTKSHEELKWTLLLLSTLFHQSSESRKSAVSNDFPSALHTTKITSHCYINNSDRVLLHTLIESLVNFTNEFPDGGHSLTLTTGLIGVPSRKISTPNSLLNEILNILQNELDSIEIHPNLKTIDLIMSLLNNAIFSVECRNILAKTNILNFIGKLQFNKIKKWNSKQQHVKCAFMQFLVHLTAYPDMQLVVAKIDDAIDILIQLAQADSLPASLMALETLRNLSFHPGNRPRLLTDSEFLAYLSGCLCSSNSIGEIKCAVSAIWALISNCERGKVAAKNYNCGISMTNAIAKLRKKQITASPHEHEAVTSIICLLEKTFNILNGSTEVCELL